MVRNNFSVNDLIYQIKYRNRPFRISIFIWGTLIYAISFSLFYSPNNIVAGGSTGLSLIIKEMFNINTSIFVFAISLVSLIIGYIYLGKYDAMKALVGSMLFPIFLEFSSVYYELFNLKLNSMFLVVFVGGVLMGLGNGMIIRSGFSLGGFQIIYQILYKKFGISIGKSTLLLNSIIIFIGSLFFGYSTAMYAVIGLYISSVVTDKVMLETSVSKTFYIITNKDKDIKQYMYDRFGYGVTVVDAKGGYTNKNKKILMCAVPTRHYYDIKSTLEEIDEDVFFLITDTYEIYGGM